MAAPLMIKGDVNARSSISLAIEELEKKALPISIRRTLPNGIYQDIPIDWLKSLILSICFYSFDLVFKPYK